MYRLFSKSFLSFFFFSSSIDVKYNIKIVSTINRRKVEGGLEATENIIYPFHAAEQSSIVVTNVCKYDRARWLETIFFEFNRVADQTGSSCVPKLTL